MLILMINTSCIITSYVNIINFVMTFKNFSHSLKFRLKVKTLSIILIYILMLLLLSQVTIETVITTMI